MNQSNRWQSGIEEARYNILRLRKSQLLFDLLTDVPDEVQVDFSAVHPPSIEELESEFAWLKPDARLAFCTRGRAAELALVEALSLREPVVLTNGLFPSTRNALTRANARIETCRYRRESGAADVDIDFLRERLKSGDVQIVHLEVTNNSRFGWPVSTENVADIRNLCDAYGAMLFVDATRLLANGVGLGQDPVLHASQLLAFADVFTISCAKEFLVSAGAIVGSCDRALIGRVAQTAFQSGTALTNLDSPGERAALLAGSRAIQAQPERVTARLQNLRTLSNLLAARGVEHIRPITGHALYLTLPLAAAPSPGIDGVFSLAAHLYVNSGIRARMSIVDGDIHIRLAMGVFSSYSNPELGLLADGVAAFLRTAPACRPLEKCRNEEHLDPLFQSRVPVGM